MDVSLTPKLYYMNVLIGKSAPRFKAQAVIGGDTIVSDFCIHNEYYGRKYVLLFFYPMDFTFVCPTEIIAFQERLKDFEQRDVAVVGCSVDSPYSHLAWLKTPRAQGGIEGVNFPLIADQAKIGAMRYGVLAGSYGYDECNQVVFEGTPVAYRGLFLIDKQGIIRHSLINDLPLGRSVDEALRMVDALQFHETYGEVCPANWRKGEHGIKTH
jgi:peroxiredoxin (alkyl hydroperoxide reductase subunit C)